MPRVLLGNTSPNGAVSPDGDIVDASITVIDVPPIITLADREEGALGVTSDEAVATVSQAWTYHSGANPAWIESDDVGLLQQLCARFGCPDKRPKKWSSLGDDITL